MTGGWMAWLGVSRVRRRRYVQAASSFAMALLVGWVCPAEGAGPGVVSFGVVPQFDQREIAAIWRPLLADLGRRTGISFELSGAPDMAVFERELMAGRFDCAYMNAYEFTRAHARQGYAALVRDKGKPLTGILVVARASAIRSPRELRGRTVAFPSPEALGATVLVRQALRDRFDVTVIPRYVHTHDSVYLNVATGQAAGGGGVKRTFDAQPEALRRLLRIIYETPGVASHPIACHRRLDAAQQARIRDALLAMGRDPAGAALLARVPMQNIGSAKLADYAGVPDGKGTHAQRQ
jgi:phosphonate transport system substrate-binding protein